MSDTPQPKTPAEIREMMQAGRTTALLHVQKYVTEATTTVGQSIASVINTLYTIIQTSSQELALLKELEYMIVTDSITEEVYKEWQARMLAYREGVKNEHLTPT